MRQPLLLGLAGVGFTAEVDKNKQLDALTSFQLGDYSLEFEGGENHGNPRTSKIPRDYKASRRTASVRL